MPNARNSDEVYLWRSVNDQALHDLGADEFSARQEAEEWFDVLNPDFVETCELAELNPLLVLDFYEENYNILTNTELTKSKRRKNAKPIR